MRSGIDARVRAVIGACLAADAARIQPSARLVDELYADSLELLDMVMALNDEFGIDIGVDDIAAIRTVADVQAAVARQLAAAA
ncbi:hypothetical protein BI347_19965 [Chromobacterium sphagni]|uniref:Acyl carrier protein n=1 Tax=Chromobacterium sphagni TaxID=1903179 RepID=A0A1S1WUV3_9NEIS|nr:acyl carrier protein [Chromobacterium sphagni]OHX10789.1 hypothetical protein BI347_19965 [Chromobacterium sphagni]